MTLQTFATLINGLAKKHPQAKVVFASDEEGNSFHENNFTPSMGNFDGSDFINDDGTTEFKKNYGVNACCIN